MSFTPGLAGLVRSLWSVSLHNAFLALVTPLDREPPGALGCGRGPHLPQLLGDWRQEEGVGGGAPGVRLAIRLLEGFHLILPVTKAWASSSFLTFRVNPQGRFGGRSDSG